MKHMTIFKAASVPNTNSFIMGKYMFGIRVFKFYKQD